MQKYKNVRIAVNYKILQSEFQTNNNILYEQIYLELVLKKLFLRKGLKMFELRLIQRF